MKDMDMSITIPVINVEFYFTGNIDKEDEISQALQVQNSPGYYKINNIYPDETCKCWGFSIGDVRSTLLSPLLEILLCIFPEYKYNAINSLKEKYDLRSFLHITIKTDGQTPYLCLMEKCINFLNQTGTTFKLNFVFEE